MQLNTGAIATSEFHELMQGFALPKTARLALAVSGGPDSMALAFLAQRWCAEHGHQAPLALIVDHALRDESAREAETTAGRLQNIGLATEILRWDHPPVTSRLHAEARKARYRLLLNACQQNSIGILLFAHQREDQAETILMRFAKGSGIDGLAGMSADSVMDHVRILRPLLPMPKERLIATCDAAQISYVTDPSNDLEKFARGRLRRVMPLLAEEGLTVESLIACGERANDSREALDFYTNEFLQRHSARDMYGVISIAREPLLALPRAIALRGLSEALQNIHAEDYPPQHAALAGLRDALRDDNMTPRTLHGCLISLRQNQIIVTREESGITDIAPIRAGESVVWDARWRVTLAADIPACEIRALGNPTHDMLDHLAPALRHDVPQGRVRSVLPALWSGEALIAIPFSGNNVVKAQLIGSWPPSF